MYKITHKETGYTYNFNSKEAAVFIAKNGASDYTVEEIKKFDWSEFFYASLTFLLISFMTLAFIYHATN